MYFEIIIPTEEISRKTCPKEKSTEKSTKCLECQQNLPYFFVQCVEIFGIAHINIIMIIGKNIKTTAWEN